MTLKTRKLSDVLGAEIIGVDLSRPVGSDDYQEIRCIWIDNLIVLFRDQQAMTPAGHLAFSRLFGALDEHTLPQWNLPDHPQVAVVSNVKEKGKHIGAPKNGRHWHSDGQYMPVPCSASMLVAREVPPEGGNTLFASMYAAYDALPEGTKSEIAGKFVLHSRVKAWPISYPDRPPLSEDEAAKLPEVIHPLVRTHPETGRPALYPGGNVGWQIEGMPFAEGHNLLKELRAFAVEDRFTYSHHWREGDVILWDNSCVLHSATPFDEEKYRRIMHRTHISGDLPYYRRDAPPTSIAAE